MSTHANSHGCTTIQSASYVPGGGRLLTAASPLGRLPSVLWEDRSDHMTFLKSAGVCDRRPPPPPTHRPPYPPRVISGGLSDCGCSSPLGDYSSWRVWRERIRAEITPLGNRTPTPGRECWGRESERAEEQGIVPKTHTHTQDFLPITRRIILKAP